MVFEHRLICLWITWAYHCRWLPTCHQFLPSRHCLRPCCVIVKPYQCSWSWQQAATRSVANSNESTLHFSFMLHSVIRWYMVYAKSVPCVLLWYVMSLYPDWILPMKARNTSKGISFYLSKFSLTIKCVATVIISFSFVSFWTVKILKSIVLILESSYFVWSFNFNNSATLTSFSASMEIFCWSWLDVFESLFAFTLFCFEYWAKRFMTSVLSFSP